VVHVRDVMTTDVVTVGLEATYSEMVDLLLPHDISGLPVVDADGIMLGLVTEADLVSREAYGPERRRPLGRRRLPARPRSSLGAQGLGYNPGGIGDAGAIFRLGAT
jgi:CBS-domain-containing membrane protein